MPKCEICGGYKLPELKLGDKVEYFKSTKKGGVLKVSGVIVGDDWGRFVVKTPLGVDAIVKDYLRVCKC